MDAVEESDARDLVIRFVVGNDGQHSAIVENFPGLMAEMTADQMDDMAAHLQCAASELRRRKANFLLSK